MVRAFLPEAPLWVAVNTEDQPIAFMLLTGDHMDALFVDPDVRGCGVGKLLIEQAGALTTLKDNGIVVPQHLSLIGFDDIPISRYTDPQLTTVRYPVMSMAKLATELALLGAAGKLDREATHCFMPTLVRRHSVAQRQTVGPITN